MREAEALRLQVHQMSAIRKVYELSKRITMTREEQIITEAKKCYSDSINCHNAFLHGVEWAELHPADVWHDAKEKPRAKEWILIQFSGGDYEALALDELGVETWSDWWCDNYKVIRYAYISDLLPKGGER